MIFINMKNIIRNNKIKMHFFKLVLVFLIISDFGLYGQDSNSYINFYSNPNESSNYWWLDKNNYGRTNYHTSIELNSETKKKNFFYKINLFGPLNDNKPFLLGESYLKYSFSEKIFLKTGRYYRDFSNYLNDQLSSGSLLISKNAEPMPKIGFVYSIDLKKNKNINFDFGIAHGVFHKNNYYTKKPFLHEKFAYINIEKNNYKIGIGLVHEAMWAGGTPSLGNFPSSFKDFLKVMIAKDGPRAASEPHANALGNHLGIWDFYLEKAIDKKKIKFYHQHIFEDTSGLRFANRFDGLWGVEFVDNLKRSNFLIEYLVTTNQYFNPPYVNEEYYHNYQYKDGWSYKDFTLGNPYINHKKIIPVDVIHFGFSKNNNLNYYDLKLSRRTNFTDDFHYKFSFGRLFKENFSLNFFIANKTNKHTIGFYFSMF